jgi:branched-chain amino acid transport system ATP-binding protein
MLEVRGLQAAYGYAGIIDGIDLQLPAGGFAALLGSNGAGKTTTLKAIAGTLRLSGGTARGEVHLGGRNVLGRPAQDIVRQGLALVPEGRRVFAPLSVVENLEMGGFRHLFPQRQKVFDERMAFVLDLFPKLRERLQQPAGTLSGGEQQMLAIGRALMSAPRVLLLDEPSMGLAPLIVEQIFRALDDLNRSGLTILVSEQNINVALRHAHMAFVLEEGRIAVSGPAAQLIQDERVRAAYLGA